jgi:phenylalanyl-tRNA synthetase beta chain
MLVSWNWLKDYVPLDMPREELEERLMMAGLNHESTEPWGDDFVIDLEVTSNRPDCLGHIGIARETATLFGSKLKLPAADPKEGATPIGEFTRVELHAPHLCWRYTARVVRGVKVGPSPDWLAKRLQALGLRPVNNIVDITNYVMYECGQPLHAFDFQKLKGQRIVVREAVPGEKFEAINHETYELAAGMCVIADAERPVALAGVMGGAETEIGSDTVDLLIEAAGFDPLTTRSTSRKLKLKSDSSYRFERSVDPEGLDWASRRACQLILELAGGELASGVIDVGQESSARKPITLRFEQIERMLGVPIAGERAREILLALGIEEKNFTRNRITVVPPSWRRDLTREIDLIEEVARIHGYHEIPEDAIVPLGQSATTPRDRVIAKLRHVLTALGFNEAMTVSTVEPALNAMFNPWQGGEPITSSEPVIYNANELRRSLVPSLLQVRQMNESLGNERIELFETAKVYLPQGQGLPNEQWAVTLTSGGDYLSLKGVVETVMADLNPAAELTFQSVQYDLLDAQQSVDVLLDGTRVGVLGRVSKSANEKLGLRNSSTIAELLLEPLILATQFVRRFQPISPYPAVDRDLNLVVSENTRWADLASVVRQSAGPLLTNLEYREDYRGKGIPDGHKSLLFSVTFRSIESTLKTEDVDGFVQSILKATGERLGASLRA